MAKIYDLSNFFNFITDKYRKMKLKLYKKKKVKKETTSHTRQYHAKFRIVIMDDINPQTSEIFNTIVPARAAFFAKIMLERNIKDKVYLEFDSLEELTAEEYGIFLESQNDYTKQLCIN